VKSSEKYELQSLNSERLNVPTQKQQEYYSSCSPKQEMPQNSLEKLKITLNKILFLLISVHQMQSLKRH
jgi:hypothetical protein